MQMFNVRYLIAVLLFCAPRISAMTIGSDTAPNLFTTQQSLTNGSRVAGFAALTGGFSLASAAVNAQWDTFFPVSGLVQLNGGTLTLTRDLIFRNTTIFGSQGNIVGNGHQVDFAPSVTLLPTVSLNAACFTWDTVKVSLSCDMKMQNSCIKFSGLSTFNGGGNVLTLDSTSTIIIASGSSLMFKNITIRGVSGTQLTAVDGTSTFSFQNVLMELDGNYSFTVGKFAVLKNLEIAGDGFVFAYRTDQVSTVSSTGRLILDEGLTFSYDPRSSSRSLLQFSDFSAELVLNSATLYSTTTGLSLTSGYLIVDGKSFLAAEGNTAATGITFGDGANAINDFFIELLPAAQLNILRGLVSYANV
jgi:hypothetical protein